MPMVFLQVTFLEIMRLTSISSIFENTIAIIPIHLTRAKNAKIFIDIVKSPASYAKFQRNFGFDSVKTRLIPDIRLHFVRPNAYALHKHRKRYPPWALQCFFETMQILRHQTSRDLSSTGNAMGMPGYVPALFVLWSYRN